MTDNYSRVRYIINIDEIIRNKSRIYLLKNSYNMFFFQFLNNDKYKIVFNPLHDNIIDISFEDKSFNNVNFVSLSFIDSQTIILTSLNKEFINKVLKDYIYRINLLSSPEYLTNIIDKLFSDIDLNISKLFILNNLIKVEFNILYNYNNNTYNRYGMFYFVYPSLGLESKYYSNNDISKIIEIAEEIKEEDSSFIANYLIKKNKNNTIILYLTSIGLIIKTILLLFLYLIVELGLVNKINKLRIVLHYNKYNTYTYYFNDKTDIISFINKYIIKSLHFFL